ncbi:MULTISPECIES: hypothetical protein [Streptomyces]|uniref:hypothetical protein n=1 Tax=Streptomyces TaxID=1883 RepID=UPI0004BD311D|nr:MULTISPECIES: hypothetical protein [Streptomyces]KJY17892.1 hypothetical protein VR43_27585 [Streptomyces sp. NRRL S-104]
MYRPRLFGRAVLAVLAVLLGGTAPAAAGTLLHGSGQPAVRAAAPAAASDASRAAPRPDRPRADPAVQGGGPSCAPASPDRGGTPAVPARAGDHAQVPPGRPVPVAARPYADPPARVRVRGPDRPAPGPVELSVMRV